jgi:Tol biopolymer transport system component/aminoglycoside phosphotransferase (APT) family kinase protein
MTVTLTPGIRLGPYEIGTPLGSGGMGEVYRARDTRLGRDVAVKVLPAAAATSVEARERFIREARAISALNHPHICTLHDVGSDGNTDYLVMELVEGETLAERVGRGPLKLDDALRLAIQIATALDRAHRAGIVHRDLKPGNVMVTRAGAKVLDFGLAQLAGAGDPPGAPAADLSAGPTIAPLTREGLLVGTLQYMAPEQLEGRRADHRADIFAFGALLYEMLTGRRAFDGSSQASVIAAVLEREPEPLSALLPIAPPALDALVRGCLTKDPEERRQSAHDIASELRIIADQGSTGLTAPRPAAPRRRRVGIVVPWIVAAAAIGVAVASGIVGRREAPAARGPIEMAVSLRTGQVGGMAQVPAVSPDESAVAYADVREDGGESVVHVRPVGSAEPRALAGTEGALLPFWSPDSREIAYFARGKVWAVPSTGGQPRAIADAAYGIGGAWSGTGTILFASAFGVGLQKVPAAGGRAEPATTLDASRRESGHAWPLFLPGGKQFLFLSRATAGERNRIEMASIEGGARTVIAEADAFAGYSPPYLLFVRDGTLLAQRFDPSVARVAGEPQVVARGLYYRESWMSAGAHVAGDALTYIAYAPSLIKASWYDAAGRSAGLAFEEADVSGLRLSADGLRIAYSRYEPTRGADDLWMLEPSRAVKSRLTTSPADEDAGPWNTVTRQLVYSTDFSGPYVIERMVPGGFSEGSLVLQEPGVDWEPYDVSPDGRTLLAGRLTAPSAADIWLVPLDAPAARRAWLTTDSAEDAARYSPDGGWIAFQSNRTGRLEVYLRRVTGGEAIQVSTDGGGSPRFRPDGRGLYFIGRGDTFFSVPLTRAGDAMVPGRPELLARIETSELVTYDVAPDGRLIVARRVSGGVSSYRVRIGWRASLR